MTAHQEMRIDDRAVHVWRAPLDRSITELIRLETLLSDAERKRAYQFYFEADRRRYIAAHGFMRLILSRYVDVSPRALAFCTGPHGKPRLREARGANCQIEFNLAHSSEVALCAVASSHRVGIDVERIRHDVPWRDIAGRFFSPGEQAALDRVPE
ncbi:MAG: 4'-phosphopantetheinyl transferase, partial [Chloroflexi bacterium]|nr:4'-phosphopantetheinyl transferase [Chloroflexota bacterium]